MKWGFVAIGYVEVFCCACVKLGVVVMEWMALDGVKGDCAGSCGGDGMFWVFGHDDAAAMIFSEVWLWCLVSSQRGLRLSQSKARPTLCKVQRHEEPCQCVVTANHELYVHYRAPWRPQDSSQAFWVQILQDKNTLVSNCRRLGQPL